MYFSLGNLTILQINGRSTQYAHSTGAFKNNEGIVYDNIYSYIKPS